VTRKAKKATMPRNAAIVSLCWQLATLSGNDVKIMSQKKRKKRKKTLLINICRLK